MSRIDKKDFPETLPGFENINRYWDFRAQAITAKILPGEYFITRRKEVITTVLGSCVSACIRDARQGIGGMNHFLLPLHEGESWSTESNIDSLATRYGNYAMEHMITDILKHGGRKKHLEVKIFGGSRIISNMTDVGKSNIEFVKNFLELESLDITAIDVGCINPREVMYYPDTGKVKVKRLKDLHNDTILKRETEYMSSMEDETMIGDIDIFKS